MEPDDTAARPVRPVDLRDHVRFAEEHATRVRVLATDHLAYDLWCIEPRQSTPVLHYPDQDTTYTVIGGRSWFVTDQGEIGLDPLAAMLVPAGTVHGIDNRGADPLIVAVTSSPPSDDAEDAPPADLRAAIHLPDERRGVLRRLADALLGADERGTEPDDAAAEPQPAARHTPHRRQGVADDGAADDEAADDEAADDEAADDGSERTRGSD